MIKQCFEFLYTLRLSLKHKVMFFVRQTYQVAGSVIMLDPVKMMNNPPRRQRFPMTLLPDKYMLSDISISICPGMFRAQNENIAILLSIKTSLPIMMLFASFNQLCYLAICASAFLLAALATFRIKSLDRLTAIYTKLRWNFARLNIAVEAKFRPPVYRLSTIRTGVSMSLFVGFINFAMRLNHISSIALFGEYINLNGFSGIRQELPA